MKHLLIGPALYTFKGHTSLSTKLGILLNAQYEDKRESSCSGVFLLSITSRTDLY